MENKYQYVYDFKALGFGAFVHFGIYSVLAKGEWAQHTLKVEKAEYEKLADKFNPKKDWAKKLVTTAKKAGCKYITLTTRHHDGFSLFDTKGLSDYDSVQRGAKRDLVMEFVDECNRQGIVPFFYHTLLDWHNTDYKNDFEKYLDYLVKSIEILCTNYGKIGGFWFDGMWDKWDADWQEDRLYSTIRKYQPNAMIINNTGLENRGKIGHEQLDSVTFERGRPSMLANGDRPRASEMCQVLNDHWGYAENDFNYKPISTILEDLVTCRANGCNFLLNVGPMPNGEVRPIDKEMLTFIGKWIKLNENFIYDCKPTSIESDDAFVLEGKDDWYYAVVKNVDMNGDPFVAMQTKPRRIKINTEKSVTDASWIFSKKSALIENNVIIVEPFLYGSSHNLKVLKFKLK